MAHAEKEKLDAELSVERMKLSAWFTGFAVAHAVGASFGGAYPLSANDMFEGKDETPDALISVLSEVKQHQQGTPSRLEQLKEADLMDYAKYQNGERGKGE